ncbi:MAG: hypothetical protein K2M47_01700 [Clostridiales bacterium]|nr:hypothetical protein [Clostridiales bacterium]
MTKLRNKIVLVLLALCLVACMGITVACGGGNDDKKPDNKPVTYTVTVKMDDTPVKGVTVTVEKGGIAYAPKTTDENGKVEFSLVKADDYTVKLDNLPENYEVPADTALTFSADRNLTVNLAEKFAYKVKLVNPDGSPFTVAGVTVGICTLSGNCLEAVELDATGLARIEAEKGDYHIKIYDLPVNYAYECDDDGYSMYKSDEGTYIREGDDNTYNSLSATKTEQTITIYPVNVLDFETMEAMTEEERAEYNDWSRIIGGVDAYKVQVEIPAGETAYYAFTAECTGTYKLYAVGYQSVLYSYTINPRFLLGETVAEGSGIFDEYEQPIEMAKGKQCYINITNKTTTTKLEIEFILATPSASVATVTGAGTVNLTLYKEDATAIIALSPTVGAAFKATVQGDAVAAIDYIGYDVTVSADQAYWAFDDDSYGVGKYTEFKFTEDQVGSTIYLAVCAKADNYPVTVSVKIEKTADVKNTTNTITTEETLAEYDRPENKELVPVPLTGEIELTKDEETGYYYYDGKIVMVMLTGDLSLDRFSAGGALIYMDLTTDGRVNPYIVDVTDWEDEMDLTKGKTYDDYRELLRGFKDYKYNDRNVASIPNPDDILVENYYAKYVNEDGAYPLTDELMEILKIIAEDQLVSGMLPMNADYENLWLFACYYYDDYLEPDAIAGEYKFVKYVQYDEWDGSEYVTKVGDERRGWDQESQSVIVSAWTEDDYKLVVNKRGSYTIYQKNNDGYEAAYGGEGTWSKTGENYSFILPEWVPVYDEEDMWLITSYEDLVYNVVFDANNGRLSLISDQFVWIFQKGGTAELVGILEDENKSVMLEIYDNDTFKLYEGYTYVASGTYVPNADGSQIAIAVTDKISAYSTVTVTYDDGLYTITMDDNEYEIDTVERPQAELLTDDGNAKMEMYEWGFKLYLKDGEEWTMHVSGEVVGGDEEHPEVEILEKDDTVSDVDLIMAVEMEGEEILVFLKTTVSYTDDTEQEYVFDMTQML